MPRFDITFKIHNEIVAKDKKDSIIKMGEMIMDIQNWTDFMIVKRVKS